MRSLACAALSLMLVACATAPAPDERSLQVKLIAFNDFHGHLEPPPDGLAIADARDAAQSLRLPTGGAAYLATAVARLKAENPRHVVVAAGDLIGAAPPISSLFHHESTIAALDAIGLNLSAVGNHEFDRGIDELRRLQTGGCSPTGTLGRDTCVDGRYEGAEFRYLAANVIDEASGTPVFPPYRIERFAFDGREIGIAFIGEVLRGTPEMVTPSGVAGLRFADEALTANALVPEIRAQGVEAIVLLIHEGGETGGDFDACPGLSGAIMPILDALDPAIDVVISGHTHQAYNCRIGERLVTSAGSYGRLLSDIELSLDAASGEVRSASAHNLPVVNAALADAPQWPPLPADAAVAALVERYRRLAAPLVQRVVGRIAADLSRTPNASGESPLGDVIADAQLAATRSAGAQIAFTNPGGIRGDLVYAAADTEADGAVTWGELFTVQPFNNRLVTMNLSGEQIHALLESQWRGGPDTYLLQVSAGFSYRWDASRPKGRRIDPADIRLHGETLDPKASYRVTVNSFMAGGGDGYTILTRGRDTVSGGSDLDALETWLGAHSPLSPPAGGRIERVD